MEKETINKLKELKQLVEDGILTQEEFENEKKQLLSAEHAMVVKADVQEVQVEVVPPKEQYRQQQNRTQQKPPRTVHIPLLQRRTVMNQTTPEGVIKKCNEYITYGKIGYGIATVLLLTFVYHCIADSFWSAFGAFFWAFMPSSLLFLRCNFHVPRYKELRDKFVGMSQAEFEYVQEVIRTKRANEKEAIITFASDFAEGFDQYAQSYARQTGSNFYSDLGAAIGSSFSN